MGSCVSTPPRHEGPTSAGHLEEVYEAFSFKGYVAETKHRAITPKQLRTLFDWAKNRCRKWHDTSPPSQSKTSGQRLSLATLNLYQLNTWLILPATRENDCSFVELLTSEVQAPQWFVSHWWGELIKDFVLGVMKHREVRCLSEDVPYWVCAYANRQHSLSKELVPDPRQTSFFHAMQLARGVLLLLDDQTKHSGPATPFSRIWCCFEESMAVLDDHGEGGIQLPIDISAVRNDKAYIITDGVAEADIKDYGDDAYAVDCNGTKNKVKREAQFPIEVLRAGLAVSLEQGHASVEEDRVRILNCICNRGCTLAPLAAHENYDKANKAIRAIFANALWRPCVENGSVQKWNLPAVLAADRSSRDLIFDFTACKKMDDSGVAAVASGLSPSLRRLRLAFGGCPVTDAGVMDLASGMPPCLEEFRIRINACPGVTDKGLTTLFAKLPTSLQSFWIDVCKTSISDVGAVALGKNITSSMKRLHLEMDDINAGDEGFAAVAAGFPDGLQDLSFQCSFTRISDKGVAYISSKLPQTLLKLEMIVFGTSVTDAGFMALAACIPDGLQELKLPWCMRSGSVADFRRWVERSKLILVSRTAEGRCVVTKTSSDPREMKLSLASNPNLCITSIGERLHVPPCTGLRLGTGHTQDALAFNFDGAFITHDGMVLVISMYECDFMEGNFLSLLHSETDDLTRLPSHLRSFVLNDDGTISPQQAPALVLGCAEDLRGQAASLLEHARSSA